MAASTVSDNASAIGLAMCKIVHGIHPDFVKCNAPHSTARMWAYMGFRGRRRNGSLNMREVCCKNHAFSQIMLSSL